MEKSNKSSKVKSVIVSSLEVQGYVIRENGKKTPFTFDVQSFTADTMSRIFEEVQVHFD